MSKELVISAKEFGVEESKAKQIEDVFVPMVKMLKSFEAQYDEIIKNEVITKEVCAKAKRLRLDISKVRIEADKVRKSEKEVYLRMGNAIQGVYNILLSATKDKEENLEGIENHFEIMERNRINELQEKREKELFKFEADYIPRDLGTMQDDVWVNYLKGVKLSYEAMIEAEKKVEAERIENQKKDDIYRKRISELMPYYDYYETGDLTRETTDIAYGKLLRKVKLAKQNYEQEQKKIREDNEKLRKQQEADRVKREAEQKKQAEALRKEREEKERIAKELQDKKDEEERKQIEADREKARIAKLGDKEIALKYFHELYNYPKPTLKSANLKGLVERTLQVFADNIDYISKIN